MAVRLLGRIYPDTFKLALDTQTLELIACALVNQADSRSVLLNRSWKLLSLTRGSAAISSCSSMYLPSTFSAWSFDCFASSLAYSNPLSWMLLCRAWWPPPTPGRIREDEASWNPVDETGGRSEGEGRNERNKFAI